MDLRGIMPLQNHQLEKNSSVAYAMYAKSTI